MWTERIRTMVAAAANGVMTYSPGELQDFESVTVNPWIREYLTTCLASEGYVASGVWVKDLTGLRAENAAGTAPGGYIFPHGFLVIATSVGGNAVCVSSHTGEVCWVDHSSFARNRISYKDKKTGKWVNLPFAVRHIPHAMIVLSPRLDLFLDELLTGGATERLEKLD